MYTSVAHELDVALTKDRRLVVIHDETVDRTTDGSGEVAEITLRELRQLDAGQGERIPTLEEVLRLLKGRIMLNIELKGLGTAEPVHRLVEFVGWRRDDLLITSFNWDMLTKYRAQDTAARIGPLTYGNLEEAMGFAETIKAYSINTYHGHINPSYVREAHSKGFKVYPWTVNEPEDVVKVIQLGVDGVISDYPDRTLNQ